MSWVLLALACATRNPPAPEAAPEAAPAYDLAGVRVALTIDDLPYQTARGEPSEPDEEVWRAVTGDLVSALLVRETPAAVFVNCDGLARAPQILDAWRSPWLTIGNHTASHVNLHQVGAEAWLADVARCQDQLEAAVGDVVYLRHPYLREGASQEQNAEAAAGLAALGLRGVPVTVATSEWLLAARYDATDDQAVRDELAAAWLDHNLAAIRAARDLAVDRVGHDVAHITLLHANRLTAEHLGELLAALDREGVRTLSVAEALEDPVYDEPTTWFADGGVSWLLRIAPAWDPNTQDWFRAQEDALGQRFR